MQIDDFGTANCQGHFRMAATSIELNMTLYIPIRRTNISIYFEKAHRTLQMIMG